ncbi:MAG: CBS domain-containing protein [bacterium]
MPERDSPENEKAVTGRRSSDARPVADYMTRKVFTLRNDKKVIAAKDIMEWAHVRHVPVVNVKGEVVGMLSHRDLLAVSMSSIGSRITDLDRKQHLWSVPLQTVMRAPVTTIGPEASVQQAASIMRSRKIGCLPVVEGGKLVGILTDHDLLRVVEES